MTTTDRCDQLICVWLHIQVVDAMENATKRNKCVAVCGRPFYWHNINIFCIRNSDIMRKRLAIKKSRDFTGNEKESWCLICFDKMRYHFFFIQKASYWWFCYCKVFRNWFNLPKCIEKFYLLLILYEMWHMISTDAQSLWPFLTRMFQGKMIRINKLA